MSKNYEIKRKKEKLREEIWRKLEKHNIARFPLPCKGRIPNFVGSGIAAKKVTYRPVDDIKLNNIEN